MSGTYTKARHENGWRDHVGTHQTRVDRIPVFDIRANETEPLSYIVVNIV